MRIWRVCRIMKSVMMNRQIGAVSLWLLLPWASQSQEVVTPQIVRDWQADGKEVAVVDVRSPGEFEAKHIFGAINIPATGVIGAGLSAEDDVVLYCGAGCSLSKRAAEKLLQKGYKNVFVLEGGIGAWEAKGNPVEGTGIVEPKRVVRARRISPRELHKQLGEGTFMVLDVRPEQEYGAGHLPGARNLPLEELEARLAEVQKTQLIVVYDRLSERSRKAGEILVEKGFAVRELAGGIGVWVAMKLPLEI